MVPDPAVLRVCDFRRTSHLSLSFLTWKREERAAASRLCYEVVTYTAQKRFTGLGIVALISLKSNEWQLGTPRKHRKGGGRSETYRLLDQ